MKQAGGADHSGAIWVLGILLVIAVSATSPYWQTVWYAILTGQLPLGAKPSQTSNPDTSGLWLTGGAFLLVVILAAVAQANSGLGAVALMLLVGLWIWFLLGQSGNLATLFALLGGQGSSGGGGGGGFKYIK